MTNARALLLSFIQTVFCAYSFNSYVEIAPSTTGTLSDAFGNHTVFLPNASATGVSKLFVFLPGTGTASSSYKYVLNTAVLMGWRSIGLAYVNNVDPTSQCGSACMFAL
jgi:hypothetical protein